MRAALPDINEVDKCEPCERDLLVNYAVTWKKQVLLKVNIQTKFIKFDCNSKIVVYLIECRICRKQYNGSSVRKRRARANNYKSTHPNFRKEQIVSNQAHNQKHFHEHYLQNDHNRICDWEITIVDHAETVKSLRQNL